MQQIRILHVVSSLNTGSGIMGFIMNYYRNINRDNVQFDFLYFDQMPNTFETEIKELGGNTYYVPRPSLRRVLSVYESYNKFFRENAKRYIAVHLHLVYLNSFLMPIAKKYGIKHLIAHSHSTKFSDKRVNNIRNRIMCLPIKFQANYFFACSKVAGETLYGKKYVKSGKVSIINNCIDTEKFMFRSNIRTSMRQDLNVVNKFVIGHVGRFSEVKNHIFLLEIFVELKKKNPDSVLLLIGDGPLLTNIKEKAKFFGIEDSVIFLGTKGNVEEYYQAMDAFVLPSLFEGLGIVLIEAQCTGLPCFVSDKVPKEAKILDNLQYLRLSDAPKEWANKILSNATNRQWESAVDSVINAGFDIHNEAKHLESIYLDIKNQ